MQLLLSLVSGLLFGIGLIVSGMINPAKVANFLDLAGHWDPSLAFVMGGALLIGVPGFHLAKGMQKPLFASGFQIPGIKDIDPKLIGGGILFGIGWGLSGLCPGPLVAGLLSLNTDLLLVAVGVVVGMWARLRIAA